MVNYISGIEKKMKIFILSCASNEDSPRKHDSKKELETFKEHDNSFTYVTIQSCHKR